jgi:phenylalanyl-tRNA synthetase beta chain
LDRVLSFPPIINGQLTSVDEGTEDLFIDVTGTDPVVHKALNIVVTALAERGGRIESVVMKGEHGQFVSPNLTEECWTIDPNEANSLIGFRLSPAKMAECLERMRFGASPSSDGLKVKVPPYRADIMHPWDIFEDIAKGYGYDNLLAEMPGTATFGMPHPSQIKRAEIRDIMIGLGYLETMPFTLTSEKVHFQTMRRDPAGHTRVKHPISEEHTMIRTTLMPSLLEILSLNQHHPLPQRIFAVGDVVKDGKNWGHLAAASIHSTAGFAEIRSVTEAVLRELDSRAEMISSEDGAFMPGRAADILVGSLTAGSFGEVHPLVLRGFGLDQPLVAMEFEWHET